MHFSDWASGVQRGSFHAPWHSQDPHDPHGNHKTDLATENMRLQMHLDQKRRNRGHQWGDVGKELNNLFARYERPQQYHRDDAEQGRQSPQSPRDSIRIDQKRRNRGHHWGDVGKEINNLFAMHERPQQHHRDDAEQGRQSHLDSFGTNLGTFFRQSHHGPSQNATGDARAYQQSSFMPSDRRPASSSSSQSLPMSTSATGGSSMPSLRGMQKLPKDFHEIISARCGNQSIIPQQVLEYQLPEDEHERHKEVIARCTQIYLKGQLSGVEVLMPSKVFGSDAKSRRPPRVSSCKGCGSPLTADHLFCDNCGRRCEDADSPGNLPSPNSSQLGVSWPDHYTEGRSQPSSIRQQRKLKHALVPRSSGASRAQPRGIDWSHVDPRKWKFESAQFDGKYSLTPKTEFEKCNGRIEDGMGKLKSDPGTYEGIFFQSNSKDWPPAQQNYTLVKRKGCGFSVKNSQAGGFTYVHAKYIALRPNVQVQPDKYTDRMSYGGHRLGQPLCPGRGQGCADVPGLKIIDESDPSDVTQGSVGDCWLLSAISALSEYDGAIRHLFRNTRNLDRLPDDSPNSYVVTLYDLPTWKPVDIVIDERLCSKPDGNGLFGCHPSATGELWVCYLEKAIAAHCGGWDKINGGTCDHAWRLLTGCRETYTFRKKDRYFQCLGSLNANTKQWEALGNSPHDGSRGLWQMPWPQVGGGGEDPRVDENGLFERMCAWEDSNYIMAAGTRAGHDSNTTDGIVDGHAYCILNCINDAGGTEWDMIKLRNPWGHGEFSTGRWRDDGPGWGQYPKVKQACNPIQADDGIFWMDKDEFFKYFVSIYLCACDMSQLVKSLTPSSNQQQSSALHGYL